MSEIVVITMAPSAALGAVRDALAMGADRAVQLADPAIQGSDLLATSRVLHRALEDARPDLVLFGPQGQESAGAMLWAAVAERLGQPVLAQVEALHVEAGVVRVIRQTEAGYETLEAPLPCVVGVTGSINTPRFAPIKGKLAAGNKPLELITLSRLGIPPEQVGVIGSGTSVLKVGSPPARGEPVVLKDRDDVASDIYAFLRDRKVLS